MLGFRGQLTSSYPSYSARWQPFVLTDGCGKNANNSHIKESELWSDITRPRSNLGIERVLFLVKGAYKGTQPAKKGNKGLLWVSDRRALYSSPPSVSCHKGGPTRRSAARIGEVGATAGDCTSVAAFWGVGGGGGGVWGGLGGLGFRGLGFRGLGFRGLGFGGLGVGGLGVWGFGGLGVWGFGLGAGNMVTVVPCGVLVLRRPLIFRVPPPPPPPHMFRLKSLTWV